MSATKVPAIPHHTGSNTDQVLQTIAATLNVREGRVGDKLDKAVTHRDLALLGIANDPNGAVKKDIAAARAAGIPTSTVGPDGYDPTGDLTPPPAPTDITLTPSIGAVFLFWNQPPYRNHSYAEVWRSGTTSVTDAVLIGTSSTQNYMDVPESTETTYYYWVRLVSQADVKGPYSQDVTGAKAQVDPKVLIAQLETELLNSELARSLAANITDVNNQVVEERASREDNDGNLYAQYTVKIDQNGHVSGFGLASETINGDTKSAFIIRADKFAIVDPTSSSNNLTNSPSSDSVPFQVTGGVVYLKSAMIANAAITSAQIASLAANKITAGYINATIGINGAKVYGAELYAGGSVTVNGDGSFTAVNPTVNISGGNATFVAANFTVKNSATGSSYTPFQVVDNVVYLDTARIRDGTISNAMITSRISSSSYNSSGTGWYIDKDGTGSFGGNISFFGSLNVKSGSSGARTEITNSVIKVFDASGTVRVKIGDLA